MIYMTTFYYNVITVIKNVSQQVMGSYMKQWSSEIIFIFSSCFKERFSINALFCCVFVFFESREKTGNFVKLL